MSDLSRILITGKIALFSCLLLAGLSVPAAAQEFCSEPVAPYCVDQNAEFDTRLQINRCEEDLVNYEEQLEEYEQCIAAQLESLREELTKASKALDEAKENL